MTSWNTVALGALMAFTWAGSVPAAEAKTRHQAVAQAHQQQPVAKPHQGRRSAAARPGRVQKGKASIYATSLQGRKMADGTSFNPASNAAASKTLPLGTKARVTNLKNGRTATVQVRDRGPHRPGRIIDVSPGTAGALGMKQDGVVPVAVAPLPTPGTE